MIQIDQLNKIYDRRRSGENHVLHDVSFTLPETGFVCILGQSGCGKTSLLNAIGGLDDFSGGTISTGDVSVSRYGTADYEAERNRSFGYIFQNYYLLPEHSVGYNVYLGLHSARLTHKEKIRRVRDALEAVEMGRYIRRNVSDLSGGQQQRIAIARALARKPRVIFADEPTGNLDEANTLNICSLLRRISRTSLVVMVTHEERIARFFADRIITLDAGRIVSDETDWARKSLSLGSGKAIYTADYAQANLTEDKISLRLFQDPEAAPVSISIVALKDRIVIKVDDPRAVSCGTSQDTPNLVEGSLPTLTLEEVDSREVTHDFSADPSETAASVPGCGITFGDMFREALHITGGKKLRNFGTTLFLILLSALLALSISDFVTLSALNPEDFITTHSQALEVLVERGPRTGSSTVTLRENGRTFKTLLKNTDLKYECVPDLSYVANVSGSLILQASKLSVQLRDCSFTPLTYLDSSTLILGRMPENSMEIVVDRWVLDKVLSTDGVAQNSISGIEYFLDRNVQFAKLNCSPTIVGICDSGEPAVYMSHEVLASVGTSGIEAMSLSSFQAMYPGKYDHITLTGNECIVLPHNAGEIYREQMGVTFKTTGGSSFTVAHLSEETDCYAKIVVADDQIDTLLHNMSLLKFWVYCEDKEAMTEYLLKLERRMSDGVDITVTDGYAEKMNAYREASALRADARTIVTATIILLCAVMLYLLRRADVHSRIGMLSVYRLLGIPAGKSYQIFSIACMITSLTTVLPTVALVWAVLGILKSNGIASLVLPWYVALLVVVGILLFQLLVTILPLRRLLKLPPARLAAKYDF